MEQFSSAMFSTKCEEAQFFNRFHQVLSSIHCAVSGRWHSTIHGSTAYNFQLEKKDLHGECDRRRVLLRSISTAKPATSCKVDLSVNRHHFLDVPFKTINVSRYVRAAINCIIIRGNAVPEDLRLEVIVVNRAQEPGLLAALDGAAIFRNKRVPCSQLRMQFGPSRVAICCADKDLSSKPRVYNTYSMGSLALSRLDPGTVV
ncbi:hypothetical protein HPB47_019542 [Ixodes persulcatus]|uniref:Uncharacterized protein n=1 Tax=Ixodes persulcatus TaxID=34615 RepID=A0AC60QHW2_IXOPE|nr:hypothetical protein HPB47_019542 [Ixodes persulcatus]